MLKIYDQTTHFAAVNIRLSETEFAKKLVKSYKFIEELILNCLKKEYLIKLDSCYYDFSKKIYVLIFRVRNKRIVFDNTVQNIFSNPDILNSVHPLDAYLIGVIYGVQANNIIYTNNMIKYFRDYDNYQVIEPSVEILRHPVNDPNGYFEIKPLYGAKSYKVSILELSKHLFYYRL